MSPLRLLRAWLACPRNLDKGGGKFRPSGRSRRAPRRVVLSLETLEEILPPNDLISVLGTAGMATAIAPSPPSALMSYAPSLSDQPSIAQADNSTTFPAMRAVVSAPASTVAADATAQAVSNQTFVSLAQTPLDTNPLAVQTGPFDSNAPPTAPPASAGAAPAADAGGGGGGGGSGGDSGGGAAPAAPSATSAGALASAVTAGQALFQAASALTTAPPPLAVPPAGPTASPPANGGGSSNPMGPSAPAWVMGAPTFAWAQEPVAPTVVNNPGGQTSAEGAAVSLQVVATDPNGHALSYAAVNLPTGLSINSGTGLITGTVDSHASENFSGNYAVTVIVSNGHGGSATQSFPWIVTPALQALVLASPGDQTTAQGDAVFLPINATQADGDPIAYYASNLPSGLTLDSSAGLIDGAPDASAALGPYAVTVTANDQGQTASTTFTWLITAANPAPVWASPGDQTNAAGDAVSLALPATDANGAALTYTFAGLPPGLVGDPASGTISGTLPFSAASATPFLVTATASNGMASSSQTFGWAVGTGGLLSPGDQTNREGDVVSLQMVAAPTSGALVYSADGLPPGASINPTTGLITGTIAAGAADGGPSATTVTASDGTTNFSQTFGWGVTPRVSLAPIPDQSNVEGDAISLQVQASEPGATLSYSAEGLPPGASVNASTGLIGGTVASGAALHGPYLVTVTATDGTYSSSQVFTWQTRPIVAPAAPVVTNPGPQSSQTGDQVSLQVQAASLAGYPLTYSATNLPDGVAIDPNTGLITGIVADDASNSMPDMVTVTADDGVGGTTSQTFPWAVNASPIAAQAGALQAVAGTDTGTITVGTFTTPDTNSQAGDFTATISWGDMTLSDGTVTGENGSFTVTADHIYAQSGSLVVGLTVTNSTTGASASASGTASVAAAPWALTGGFQQGAVAGEMNSLVVGTIQDGDPNVTAGNFSVMIDRGDGSGPQMAGMVTPLGNGLWSVSLASFYTQTGAHPVTLTVTGPGGAVQTATSTIEVGHLYAGVLSNLTVAQFSAGDWTAQASDFAATIDWGDGSSSTGTVSGSYGFFAVQGSHAYAVDSIDAPSSAYQVTVVVSKAGQTVLSATQGVVVVRPQVALQVANVVENADGTVSNQVVARFEGPDVSDPTSEFVASVNWGDGTTSAGTVSGSNGLFVVVSGHSYASPGAYVLQVDVSQGWSTFGLTAFGLGLAAAAPPILAPTARLGAVGDSLTAGMSYGVLSATDQPFGYPSQLAQALGVSMNLPLMRPALLASPLGLTLANATFGPPNIVNFSVFPRGVVQGGRQNANNAGIQNYGVPGATINDLLTQNGTQGFLALNESVFSQQILQNTNGRGKGTQIQQVRRINPTMVLVNIGSNDLLQTFTSLGRGARAPVTSAVDFSMRFTQLLRELTAGKNAPNLVLMTLPDVTKSPQLIPVNNKALKLSWPRNFRLSIGGQDLTRLLPFMSVVAGPGVAKGSYVSLTTVLFNNRVRLVRAATAAAAGMPPGNLTFEITQNEAISPAQLADVQATERQYNAVIQRYNGGVLNGQKLITVDVNKLFSAVAAGKAPPIALGGKQIILDGSFSGGAVSADGLHPTYTGYALVANTILQTLGNLNAPFGGFTRAQLAGKQIDLAKVLQADTYNPKHP